MMMLTQRIMRLARFADGRCLRPLRTCGSAGGVPAFSGPRSRGSTVVFDARVFNAAVSRQTLWRPRC
jgi:hypothetical protein